MGIEMEGFGVVAGVQGFGGRLTGELSGRGLLGVVATGVTGGCAGWT
jgi:hypothetical protein